MADYFYINAGGEILKKVPKGRGRVRKGAQELPEGSGKWFILVPDGVEVEDLINPPQKPKESDGESSPSRGERWLIETDIDGEEINRHKLAKGEHKPKSAIERPEGSGLFYVVVDPEAGISKHTGRKRARSKVDFPLLKRSLFVSQGDCGWNDGWEDGRNVFWADKVVIAGHEGIGELQFNAVYPRIELDFDNGTLTVFGYVGREIQCQDPDDEYDPSRLAPRIVYEDAIEGCNLDKERELPKPKISGRVSA